MATITAYVNRTTKKLVSIPQNYVVANSVTIPVGAYTMLPGTSGDTANRGLLDNYLNESTSIFVGLCESWGGAAPLTAITNATVVGNTAPANPYQAIMAAVETGPHILRAQNIAGGSAQSDVGKKVWMLNNNDFTFTSQLSIGLSNTVGRCCFFNTSTNEDVLIYGMIDVDLMTS